MECLRGQPGEKLTTTPRSHAIMAGSKAPDHSMHALGIHLDDAREFLTQAMPPKAERCG